MVHDDEYDPHWELGILSVIDGSERFAFMLKRLHLRGIWGEDEWGRFYGVILRVERRRAAVEFSP